MKSKHIRRLACIAALAGAIAAAPSSALAWGYDGHKVVGAIAAKLLKGSVAEQQVKALLLPGETLESIAIWADCVKGDWCGPQSKEMVDYVAANPQHSEYHYTDVPFQLSAYHDHGAGTTEVDIVQTLKQAITVLQGKDTPETNPHRFTKRQALLVVVHLAGDIVQPLHVGAGFVDKEGRFVIPQTQAEIDSVNVFDPRGGNNLLLNEAATTASGDRLIPPLPDVGNGAPKPPSAEKPRTTRPFHSYWDSTVVTYAMRRSSTRTPDQFAQYAIDTRPVVAASKGDVLTWPYQWADDTLAVSRIAYRDVRLGAAATQTSKSTGETYRTWEIVVPDDYAVPSSAIAREQLIKGGYRLAELLKAIWS